MKKLLILFACLPLLGACTQTEPVSGNRAAAIVAEIHNPRSKYVVVASHRGDWRNYPENSIAAIESVIGMGVDIMELDLKLTKDSVLVLCHDRTIDRTTSGKGRVCDITYDSIRRCVRVLKTTHRHGVKTMLVNVDRYEYYDLVLAVTGGAGASSDRILIRSNVATRMPCRTGRFGDSQPPKRCLSPATGATGATTLRTPWRPSSSAWGDIIDLKPPTACWWSATTGR